VLEYFKSIGFRLDFEASKTYSASLLQHSGEENKWRRLFSAKQDRTQMSAMEYNKEDKGTKQHPPEERDDDEDDEYSHSS
jgi:hypothetical protein